MAYTIRDYLILISAKADKTQEILEGMAKAESSVSVFSEKIEKVAASYRSMLNNVRQNALVKTVGKSLFFAKSLARQTFGFTTWTELLIKGISVAKSNFRQAISLADNLSETAKSQNKTVEDARASQVALAAMGKTLADVERSAELKKTYNELVEFGKKLRLTSASENAVSVRDVTNSLSQLKVTVNYVLLQAYEYFKIYAADLMKQVRSWLEDNAKKAGKSLSEWTKDVGKQLASGLSDLLGFGKRVITSAGKILDAAQMLIQELKGNEKMLHELCVVLAATITAWMLAFSPLTLVFMLLYALIDDYVTWASGGASAFGDVWVDISDALTYIANHFKDMVDAYIRLKKAKWLWKGAKFLFRKLGMGAAQAFALSMIISNSIEGIIEVSEDYDKDPYGVLNRMSRMLLLEDKQVHPWEEHDIEFTETISNYTYNNRINVNAETKKPKDTWGKVKNFFSGAWDWLTNW